MNISKNHTDPKYLGPGNWHSIHLMAANANTMDEKKAFLWFIKVLSENFYCNRCKVEFLQYLKDDDPIFYIDKPEGMFFWSFNFHNTVNKRLGKQIMLYHDAKSLYFNPKTCLTNCMSPEIKEDFEKNYTFKKIEPVKEINKKPSIHYL